METIAEKNQFIKRLLIICAVITLIILAVIGVSYIVDILMLIFAAVLIAIFLRGLADLINERLGISEGKAVLLVSVLIILILAGSIALLAPSVAEQIRHLRDELPRSIAKCHFISFTIRLGQSDYRTYAGSAGALMKLQIIFQQRVFCRVSADFFRRPPE